MLFQLSYCPRVGCAIVPALPVRVTASTSERDPRPVYLASLLVKRVLTLVRAVLLHLEALTIVDLRLHRDVVAPLAFGALEGHFDPFVAL